VPGANFVQSIQFKLHLSRPAQLSIQQQQQQQQQQQHHQSKICNFQKMLWKSDNNCLIVVIIIS